MSVQKMSWQISDVWVSDSDPSSTSAADQSQKKGQQVQHHKPGIARLRAKSYVFCSAAYAMTKLGPHEKCCCKANKGEIWLWS